MTTDFTTADPRIGRWARLTGAARTILGVALGVALPQLLSLIHI